MISLLTVLGILQIVGVQQQLQQAQLQNEQLQQILELDFFDQIIQIKALYLVLWHSELIMAVMTT